MKENDYILANILNPGFSNQDFKDILGMNMENTQILPYSSYTSSPFITQNELFQDNYGNFSEQKFKDFYTTNVEKFSTFNVDQPVVDNFEYSFFDTSRKSNSRVKDPNFKLSVVSNPDRISIGISGRNKREESKLSRSEMAQQAKIYDYNQGKWLDYSPNDVSLVSNPIGWFKSLFDEPLVKATWDEAGDHKDPITKEIVHHEKGDLKLNNDGQYFYETLGNRSPIGKEVLSSFDILTVDGEGINKYDFIDSDGLDKSVVGTIAKTALTVAPLFIGGPTAAIYSGALIAREMGKSLPMLYGMVSSLWGNEEDSQLLNTIATYGDKFSSGTSEYSRQNTFTFENIASLIGDVATQWGQQRAIAESVNKLRGSKKLVDEAYKKAAAYYELEARAIQQGAINSIQKGQMQGLSPLQYIGDPAKWQESALGKAAIKKFVEPAQKLAKSNMRLGADASLAYMAIVSNTDVYQSMLEHGASKRDAAAVAFGSTLGMFAVDKYLGLGEMFFDELRNDTRLALRNAFRKESDAVAKGLIGGGEGLITNPEVRQNAIKRLVKKGMDFSKEITEKFASDVKNHAAGVIGKAVGEGLEEVSEELVTDLSKQLYQIAGEFSPNFINESGITDVGAWENMKERYLMSLLGGTLGGGLFYGVDIFQRGSFKRDTTKDELIYLIANNKTQEALKELDRWKAAGKFGSKTLSASKYEYDAKGNPVFLTAENEDDSQNTFIYNRIKESILQLENILNQTGTNLSEDDLFKQMVLSEQRFLNLKDFLQNQSYTTKYQEQFRTITRELIEGEQALSMANKTVDGTPTGDLLPDSPSTQAINDPTRLENIEKLKQKVEGLRAQRDSFLSGEQSLPYTEKMLFAIDKYLNSAFTSMTYDTWLQANKGKKIDDLSAAEKQVFKEEYLKYKENKQALDLDKAFEVYKAIKKVVDPHIAQLAENADAFQINHEALTKLFDDDGPINKLVQISYEDKLEGETDEDYANRNTQLEGETDEDFKSRKAERNNKIKQYNEQQLQNLSNEISQIIQNAGGYIDPSTQRFIHNSFTIRRNDVASQLINSFIAQRQYGLSPGITMQTLEAMKNLKPDLSNLDEVRQEMFDIAKNPHRKNLETRNRNLEPIMNGLTRMFKDFGYSYDPNTITGATVLDFMNTLATRIQAGDKDIENIFQNIDRTDTLLKLYESQDLLGDLMSYSMEEEGLLEHYLGEDGEQVYDEEWAPIANSIDMGQENYDMHIYSKEEINDKVDEMSQQSIDYIEQTLAQVRDNVVLDPFVQMLDEVDRAVTSVNPITKLLKELNIALDSNNRNIEEILDSLHRKALNIDSLDNFTLTEDQEQSIRDAEQLLSTVKAYLYAAGVDSNYAFPVGHNKVINDFAKNHPGVFPNFEELPTLDQSVADMYLVEIDKYLRELSENSATSWISLSNRNRMNKRQKLINAEAKFNDAKLEFLDIVNKSQAMQFIINGKSYNLLEGIETISDENPAIRLHKIEDLFYINLHKALADGLTFKQILEESKMLENLLDIKKVSLQSTSELDDTINYGKLTDFDKLVYLLTISGISSNEFGNFIKERVEESKQADSDKKIVPLTIQEQTSRIALAQIKSKEIFSQALEYIKEVTKDDRPILDYLIFVDGSAGVGKTQVIAKNASKFVQSDNIWLSAPKDTQLRTLKEVIGKGQTKSRTDLLNLIIDPATYQKLLQQMKETNKNTDLFSTKNLPGDNTAQVLNLDAITFNDVQDPPELIIIDEVTHYSGLELQILNEFAKRYGISILALGDTNQNGFKGLSRNIDREKIITIRSPKLSISLRDVNLQKQENLLNVLHILNGMSKLDSDIDPLYDQKFKELTKLIGQINFRVYNQDELNGDLITKTLTSEQVGKMFGKVAFVGDTNDDAYKVLKEHRDNIEEVIVLNPEEIQGQEFDFIVVDQSWNLDTSKDIKVFNFLTDLYTMMSRGKSGSIFIDKGLSNIIGQNKESLSKEMAPNLRDAIEPFIEAKLATLEQLGLIPNEEFGQSEVKTPKVEPPKVKPTGKGFVQDIKQLIDQDVILNVWTNGLGRECIIAKVNGVLVPFYRSSKGTDGKVKGKWYPFFGFGTGSRTDDISELDWLIKGDVSDMEVGYGIAELKKVQDTINSMLTYPENSFRKTNHDWFDQVGMEFLNKGSEDLNKLVLGTSNPEVKNGVNAQAHIQKFLQRIKDGTNPEPEVLPEDESLIVDDEIETDEETEQDRQDMIKTLGDKTDELIEQSIENIELDPDFPIRIYGSAHFAGLLKVKKTVDGKEVNTYTNPHSEVKSDLQIFMKGDEADGAEMNSLVSSLLNLKSVILYGDNPSSLHSSVTSVVDAEHLKDIKYKIEVRPLQDTDNFVGFTGLDSEGEEGNRPDINGLVYTLVGEFKNNVGETCKVTLGLLANPDSFFVSEQAKKKGKETEVQSRIQRYKKVFENITKQYKRDGKFYQDVTPQFSGLTHIRRTTGVGSSRRLVPVRTLEAFKAKHPYTVVSDPYIFIGKNFKGLQTSKIRGHAVVFVSNDRTLKPDELMQIYIEQKEATIQEPNANLFNLSIKPRVRMLVLDPVGVSFKSLTFTKKMKDLYSTEQIIDGKKCIKMFPFEEDYMGARMYTALWNYRVNLQKFLDAYKTFRDKNNLSDEDITRIACYSDAMYKQNHSQESELSDDIQEILSTMKATAEEMKLLSDFNDSLASSVRQFRIGGSRKASGVYLRNLTNISSDNTFYQGIEGTPVGIYITPAAAQKQFNLINTLLSDVLGNIVQLKDKKGNTWPIDRAISPRDGFNNSLSGLITDAFAGSTISITEDGINYDLQLPDHKKSFKHIPILLSKIYYETRKRQNNPGENYENIVIGEKSGNPLEVNYLKLVNLLAPSSSDSFDGSFDELLALAFHGTTSDPTTFVKVPNDEKHKGQNPVHSSMRATDAYFKNGFYIDPMGAEAVGITSTGSALFKRCLTNEGLFTVNVETDMPIFTVTLTNLEKAYNDSITPVVTQQDIISQQVRDTLSDPENVPAEIYNDVQELLSTVKSMEELQQKCKELMEHYLQKELIPRLFQNRSRPSQILAEKWNMDIVNGQFETVQKHLEQLSGKSFEGATVSWDNENLLVTLSDGKTHIEIGFDEYSSKFTTTTIMENPEPNTGTQEEKAAKKLQTAKEYIKSYLSDPENAEKLEDFRSEYEEIYNELTTKINSYTSIEDLMKALQGMEEPTEWDDVIIEIEGLVSNANEGLKCKY